MKNQPKKSSSATPIIIIGLVLIIALGGGFLLYRSSTAPRTNTNRNTAANKAAAERTPIVTNQMGAQPPNMLGGPTATVTIEEFADFQCGMCAQKHPMTKEIISAYGTRIKFVFRNYPLAMHDKAYAAAVAAEAAGIQNKFWDMQSQLFTNQQSWASSSDFPKLLTDYAQKIGLDVEKFKNDMAGLQAKQRVDADMARGRALGVGSTPSFFINGKAIPFEQTDVTTLRQIIDAELLKAQNPTQTAPAQTAPAQTAPAANSSNANTNK